VGNLHAPSDAHHERFGRLAIVIPAQIRTIAAGRQNSPMPQPPLMHQGKVL